MTITPKERAHIRSDCTGVAYAVRLLDALEAAERELAACKAKLAALVSAVGCSGAGGVTLDDAVADAKEAL